VFFLLEVNLLLRGLVLGCKENPDYFDACFFDEKQTKGVVYAGFTPTKWV
jgi:hypothetical protein